MNLLDTEYRQWSELPSEGHVDVLKVPGGGGRLEAVTPLGEGWARRVPRGVKRRET
jgi:hypothetical protein